jgi:hypothetical protein
MSPLAHWTSLFARVKPLIILDDDRASTTELYVAGVKPDAKRYEYALPMAGA